MRKGFGLLLILTLILTLGTIVQNYRFDSSAALERSSALALQQEAGSVEVALADLRAAQAAYLAVGQDHRFWISRAADLTTQIVDGLGRLSAATTSADASRHYDAARTALTDLGNVDRRARDFVTGRPAWPGLGHRLRRGPGRDAAPAVGAAGGSTDRGLFVRSPARPQCPARIRHDRAGARIRHPRGLAGRARASAGAVSEPASTAQMIRDLPPPVKAPNGEFTRDGRARHSTDPAARQ